MKFFFDVCEKMIGDGRNECLDKYFDVGCEYKKLGAGLEMFNTSQEYDDNMNKQSSPVNKKLDILKSMITESIEIHEELLKKLARADIKSDGEVKPEGEVRIKWIIKLIKEYGWDSKEIDIEVPIPMGVDITKKADIVVYTDEKKVNKHIIIETKQPDRKDGVEQLVSYIDATGVKGGAWSNSKDGGETAYLFRKEPNIFIDIPDLPRKGEEWEDVGARLKRKDLKPAVNLVSDFKDAEDYILAHQGVDVFNELFKLFYAKLYDENVNLKKDDSICEFKVGIKENPELVARRIKKLFDGAVDKWEVFKRGEGIELRDDVLAPVASRFQKHYLWKTDMDVLGTGFEYLVTSAMKGEKGQYFTPRQVVRMIVEMLNPQEDDKILDPACGSGGFLI